MNISVTPGSGFDPNSPQFATANKSCKRFIPKSGSSIGNTTITTAEQTDYLKSASCMRAHGILNFPDPSFSGGSVDFTTTTPIDTTSTQYEAALTICQKLIPAGLPYSSGNGS